MRIRIRYFPNLLFALVFLAGCASTGELTPYEKNICEVHNVSMKIEEIPCHPGGFSGYLPEFNSAMRTQFPHHGRTRFSEDHGYLYARHLRTHVCDECTKAFDQWQSDHQTK